MKSAGDTRLSLDSKLHPDEDGVFGARTDVKTYISKLVEESALISRACLMQLFVVPMGIWGGGYMVGSDMRFFALLVMLGLGINLLIGAVGALNFNFRLQKYDNEVFMRTIIYRLSEMEKKSKNCQ